MVAINFGLVNLGITYNANVIRDPVVDLVFIFRYLFLLTKVYVGIVGLVGEESYDDLEVVGTKELERCNSAIVLLINSKSADGVSEVVVVMVNAEGRIHVLSKEEFGVYQEICVHHV